MTIRPAVNWWDPERTNDGEREAHRRSRRAFLRRATRLSAAGLIPASWDASASVPEPPPDRSGELTHRRVEVDGVTLHVVERGRGREVILLHGFPELWYSWKHQLPALAEAGYHAVAPDLRGFGRSDAPAGVEHYTMTAYVNDVIGLLDALDASTGVVVGLDWGARIAWTCAQRHPHRIAGVVALGVPFYPRPERPPSETFLQSDGFSIVEYFQTPGVAEAELERDVRRSMLYFLATLYGGSSPDLLRAQYLEKPAGARLLDGMPEDQELPAWLSEDDLAYYTREFERTGFETALNLYRNMDRNWRESEPLAGVGVKQPALFIGGERDPALLFGSLDPMKEHVPHLRKIVLLPDGGHLVQLEHPGMINAEIVDFLGRELR